MVLVRLFASFREVVGRKEIVIPADSIKELIWKLIDSYEKISPLPLESAKPLKLRPYDMILGICIAFIEELGEGNMVQPVPCALRRTKS